MVVLTYSDKNSNDMKDKIIKLLSDWKVNKHKQELMAEELLILCGVVKSFTAEQILEELEGEENIYDARKYFKSIL
tara:strand:+ start:5859 stop:6086 length:228 start_codon:yes stop_codon:yes gene_type:complete